MDRSEASRMLGKVLAYLACGKTEEASAWARKLVAALRAAGLEC